MGNCLESNARTSAKHRHDALLNIAHNIAEVTRSMESHKDDIALYQHRIDENTQNYAAGRISRDVCKQNMMLFAPSRDRLKKELRDLSVELNRHVQLQQRVENSARLVEIDKRTQLINKSLQAMHLPSASDQIDRTQEMLAEHESQLAETEDIFQVHQDQQSDSNTITFEDAAEECMEAELRRIDDLQTVELQASMPSLTALRFMQHNNNKSSAAAAGKFVMFDESSVLRGDTNEDEREDSLSLTQPSVSIVYGNEDMG